MNLQDIKLETFPYAQQILILRTKSAPRFLDVDQELVLDPLCEPGKNVAASYFHQDQAMANILQLEC